MPTRRPLSHNDVISYADTYKITTVDEKRHETLHIRSVAMTTRESWHASIYVSYAEDIFIC